MFSGVLSCLTDLYWDMSVKAERAYTDKDYTACVSRILS